MSLSKPIRNALISYLSNLYEHPIRTKAITCCIVAAAGNLASQWISQKKPIDIESLKAYSLYGLLFGGPIPHFYYNLLERAFPEEASLAFLKKLFVDRFIFTPIYQAFSLYMLARLEAKTHSQAIQHLLKVYWPLLSANWKLLTILQLINIALVPPILRVLTMNLIGFFWVIYITNMRRKAQDKGKKDNK